MAISASLMRLAVELFSANAAVTLVSATAVGASFTSVIERLKAVLTGLEPLSVASLTETVTA